MFQIYSSHFLNVAIEVYSKYKLCNSKTLQKTPSYKHKTFILKFDKKNESL